MVAHANPRLYIGPLTNQIIIELGRAYNTSLAVSKPNVTLTLIKRRANTNKRCKPDEYVLTSYVVNSKGQAMFELTEEFMTESPKGFYDGLVSLDGSGCDIGKVEVIRSPGTYITGACTTDSCTDTLWVEPSCKPDDCCDCGYSESTDGCYHCNRTIIVAQPIQSPKGYGMNVLEEEE